MNVSYVGRMRKIGRKFMEPIPLMYTDISLCVANVITVMT
jgi:hypothetical protein